MQAQQRLKPMFRYRNSRHTTIGPDKIAKHCCIAAHIFACQTASGVSNLGA